MRKQLLLLMAAIGFMMAIIPSFGQSNIKSEIRQVGSFQAIQNNSSVDILILQGNNYVVKIEADTDIVPYITTEERNSTLYIDIKERLRPRKIKVMRAIITVPDLNAIKINGSGDVVSMNQLNFPRFSVTLNGSGDAELELKCKEFESYLNGSGDLSVEGVNGSCEIHIAGSGDMKGKNFQLSNLKITSRGSGDIKLTGKADEINIYSNASGDINCVELPSSKAEVQCYGSGDVSLWVVQTISGTIYGSGDIRIKGNPPHQSIQKRGSGDAIWIP